MLAVSGCTKLTGASPSRRRRVGSSPLHLADLTNELGKPAVNRPCPDEHVTTSYGFLECLRSRPGVRSRSTSCNDSIEDRVTGSKLLLTLLGIPCNCVDVDVDLLLHSLRWNHGSRLGDVIELALHAQPGFGYWLGSRNSRSMLT